MEIKVGKKFVGVWKGLKVIAEVIEIKEPIIICDLFLVHLNDTFENVQLTKTILENFKEVK